MKEWLLEASGRRPSSGDRGRRRCDEAPARWRTTSNIIARSTRTMQQRPCSRRQRAGLQRRTAAAGDPNDAAAGGSSRATRRRGTAAPEIANRRSRTAGAAAAIARTAAAAVWLWRTEADDHAAAVRRDSDQWRRLRLLRCAVSAATTATTRFRRWRRLGSGFGAEAVSAQ
ncbi:hypothetical protein Scep_020887 [Stephania cephalantha]|uniref:Uncharacterized protein n=1 Tax=Stephania cephalantha TaxID=152367 RepID=A0AAP0F7I0_9MAGN